MSGSFRKAKKLFTKTLLAASFAGMTSMASAGEINLDKLVVFGDSLSDNGTLAILTQGQAPETFTNGQVWSDYLAEDLGVPQVNLAVAGARVVGHDNDQIDALSAAGAFRPLGIEGVGVKGQVSSWLATKPGDQSNTLHTVFVGGNDILAYIEGRTDFQSRVEVADYIVKETTANIARLTENGAKNILVFLQPDVGNTPIFDFPVYEGRENDASRIATLVNNKLTDQLYVQQRKSENSYNLLTVNGKRILNNVSASGDFKNTEETWLVLDENRNPTGNVNGNPNEFIYWDSIHPTTRAHRILADSVMAALEKSSHCLGNDDCTVARELTMQ